MEDPRFGYSLGCKGCDAARARTSQRAHTPACRNRFRKLFMQFPDTRKRVEAAEQRLKPQPIEPAPAPEQMEVEQQPPQPGAEPEDVPIEGPAEAQAPSADSEMDEETHELYSPSDPAEEVDTNMGAIIPILANIAIEKIKFGHHVTEVYSPPRVNISATKIGLVPGMSLDLTEVDPVDGKPWDFTDTIKRTRARERE